MRTRLIALVLLALLAGFPAFAADAADKPEPKTRAVDAWLLAGPFAQTLPALHDQGEDFEAKSLLGTGLLDPKKARPERGSAALVGTSWQDAKLEDGAVAFGGEGLASAFLATKLDAPAFFEGKLVIECKHPVAVHLDGKPLAGNGSYELALSRGVHRLLVETLRDPSVEEPWTVSAKLEGKDEARLPRVTTAAGQPLAIRDILDAEGLSSVSLSHDGSIIALRKSQPSVPADHGKSWHEFLDAANGKVLRRTPKALGKFQWSPVSNEYTFVTADKGKATLWLATWNGGSRALLEDVEHLAGYAFAPDGKTIVYSISTPEEKRDTKGLDEVRSIEDRWPGYRDTVHLWELRLEDGRRRRLTAGAEDTSLADIRADGKALLFTRSKPDATRWPMNFTELWQLDLTTLEAELLVTAPWTLGASYSPDGKSALVTGSPLAFGEMGLDVPEGVTPNIYDGQAYLFDIAKKKARPLTKDFDPALTQVVYSKGDGQIYLRAEDGEYVRLYRCDPAAARCTALPVELDNVARWDIAADASRIALVAASSSVPPELQIIELGDAPRVRTLVKPNADALAGLKLGKVETFTFESKTNGTIDGHVVYPYDFDAKKSYPAIIYYYGGTSPVSRGFGGRWPENVWAAHGYIVYVLQPSGATGYGQEFSARHVNNWGDTVVGEIIEGTDAFLKAHPFVDPERLGCMGASYGGFMTQLLITHTDKFSAAISHAGISSLSSYWGEGFWGTIYSAGATAKKFPWNAPEIYVGRSALFRADKITTPLLLLHGAVDTNVPPGESDQMHAALRILGRDVHYVKVEGENHLIMDYVHRKKWMETILAYFDWKLKEDSAWWEHLYPAP